MLNSLRCYWELANVLKMDGSVSRIITFTSLISIPIKKKLFGRRIRRISLKYAGQEFDYHALDGADIAVLREVFLDEEYKVELEHTPKNILDIGSHVGASVIYFKITCPNVKIVACEPDRENFEILKLNTAQFKDIECLNYAVASTVGDAILRKVDGSSISGSIVETHISNKGVMVSTTTLDDVLGHFNGQIDLLKFDVEGSEYDVFYNSAGLSRVQNLVGELHLDLIGKRTKQDFYNIFSEFDVKENELRPDRYIVYMHRK